MTLTHPLPLSMPLSMPLHVLLLLPLLPLLFLPLLCTLPSTLRTRALPLSYSAAQVMQRLHDWSNCLSVQL